MRASTARVVLFGFSLHSHAVHAASCPLTGPPRCQGGRPGVRPCGWALICELTCYMGVMARSSCISRTLWWWSWGVCEQGCPRGRSVLCLLCRASCRDQGQRYGCSLKTSPVRIYSFFTPALGGRRKAGFFPKSCSWGNDLR